MARPLAVDLFAGAGGMSLGFEQAGFDIVCAVENDPVHCATHMFNFPTTPILCRDMATVTGDDLRRAAGLSGDDTLDCLFGGPPCQGFSFIGKRLVDDPRNALVGHFIRLAGELRPRYVVLENVPGIASGRHGEVLEEAVRELTALGYTVAMPQQILDASHFGVPQRRRRLFMLAWAEGANPPVYPQPSSKRSPVSVWEAIGDLPSPDDYPLLLETDAEPAALLAEPESLYAAQLRGLVRDLTDYGYPRAGVATGLTSSMRTVHTERSARRFESTEPGSVEVGSRFLRLDPRGYCNTLRAGTGADRGAYTSPRPIHPFEPRCITVREAARLHSYPDWFRFHTTKWHGFRQVGNSVPPLLARAVAAEVVSALGHQPSTPHGAIALGDAGLLSLTPSSAATKMGVARMPGRRR